MSTQYIKYCQDPKDPINDAKFNGRFQVFFSNSVVVSSITPNYTIDNLITEINSNIDFFGLDVFSYTDHRCPTADIAQFVKINKLYHSLTSTPNLKPWLLYVTSNGKHTICGESRQRAIELIPEITHISAFASVPVEFQHQYQSWTPVNTFDEFATLTACQVGTPFWFRTSAEYGLDWYEFAVDNYTGTTGPGFREWCITAIKNYVKAQPKDFKFSREWFKQKIDWDQYVLE